MSNDSNLKKALRESNAIGWLALFALVFAVGVGAVYFGTGPAKVGNVTAINEPAK